MQAKKAANKEIAQLKNELTSSLTKLQETESSLKVQISHYQTLLEQKNEEYNVQIKKAEKLEKELSEIGHNSEKKVNSVTEEKDRLEKLYQMQLTEKQEELSIKETKMSQLSMELDKVRHCFSELQVGYDRLKVSYGELKQEKSDTEKACTGLGEKFEDLKQEKTNLEAQHATEIKNTKTSLEMSQQMHQSKFIDFHKSFLFCPCQQIKLDLKG